MDTERRLLDIEVKLTAQEDLVQTLNQTVYRQQRQIDDLRALCTALIKRLGDMADASDDAGSYPHEKPPHY